MIHFEKSEEHLVDKIIQIKLTCSYLTPLIEKIINNFDLFSSSMAMLELFNNRLNFIENKLKTMSRDEPKYRFNYSFFSEMTYSQYSEEKFKIKRKIGIYVQRFIFEGNSLYYNFNFYKKIVLKLL